MGITAVVSAARGLEVDVTQVVPGTAATHLGKAEDAAHSGGDTGVMGLAVRRDADTTLVGADNDYAPLQVDADGALKVEIFDGGDRGVDCELQVLDAARALRPRADL